MTGSSSGIGRAIALEFARAGADVVVHCRQSAAAAEKVAAEIRDLGRSRSGPDRRLGGCRISCRPSVDAAWRCFGSVDLWVNNAGVDLLTGRGGRIGLCRKARASSWTSTCEARPLVASGRRADVERRPRRDPQYRLGPGGPRNGGGKWRAFCSVQERGDGFQPLAGGQPGPAGSGELHRTRAGSARRGAKRLAKSGRSVCGEETPLARWGTPEDVAKLARFLASDDADFITGQVIRVNGGAVR